MIAFEDSTYLVEGTRKVREAMRKTGAAE